MSSSIDKAGKLINQNFFTKYDSNLSNLAGNTSLFSENEEIILVLCIGCGTAAFFLNVLVLLVFLRNASSAANSGIRILTVTEIMYTGTRVASDSLLFAGKLNVFPVFCGIVSITLCIRNWWFAILTICRCIAIFVPLKAKHLLTVRRQILVYIAIALPSLLISMLRNLWLFHWNQVTMELPLFLFQGGIPVPIVVTTSVIMVAYLLGAPRNNLPRALYTLRRATRTVFSLAILFALLESPAFIITSLSYAGVSYPGLLDVISNLTSVLDSMTNFAVFLVNSRNFKLGLMNLPKTTRHNSSRIYQIRSSSGRYTKGGSAKLRQLDSIKEQGMEMDKL